MPPSHTVEHPAELLAFLFAWRPEVKRTTVRQWLEHGSIQVNGRAVTRTRHTLQIGDVVSIRGKAEVRGRGVLPLGVEIVFEDASLLVVEKPEGLLSMASGTERDRTAYAVLTDYVRRGHLQGSERVWIVHRLDRETSGVMVFARTEAVKRTLQARWEQTEKRYLAVVEGHPPADHGVLRSHLDERGPYRVYSAPRSKRTREAVTRYRVVKRTAARALVELTPTTGRRNQLRVHLSEAGCPIVGDGKYGARTNPARRLGLHAGGLQFRHPETEELRRFDSALPDDLARLL